MQDGRRFLRVPENLPISYESWLSTETKESLTKDISQEGISFFVHKFIPKYSLLKIKLTLKKTPFYFEGLVRVVWIKKEPGSERYEVGVEFINIPKKATEHLTDYIKGSLK